MIGAVGVGRDRPDVPPPLASPVADSHCHLDMARPDSESDGLLVPDLLAVASSVGVARVVQIGCDRPSAPWAVEAASTYANVVAGVALHPNEAPREAARGTLSEALDEIEKLARSSDRVRAIGETGLDHFRTAEPEWAVQEESFRAHIEMAKRLDRTLVIHDRDSHDDILRVLADEGAPSRVVMHCFSGDHEMARECVRRGYWLSFAGTVTFKNASSLRNALAVTPLDRVLVETDAPFLTPAPHRGKPNASYLIPLTIRAMIGVLDVPEETLCRAIDANTDAAFGPW